MSYVDSSSVDQKILKTVMASLVKIIAVLLLLYWCFAILSPFLSILIWGVIIAGVLFLSATGGYKASCDFLSGVVGAVILALGYELLIAWMVRPVNSDGSR